jgi:DnaJ-class molecular chaperone
MIYTSVLLKQFLGSKDIEAINGKVRIKLEEGIQSGKILRLKGKGFQVSMATETEIYWFM